MGLSLVRKWYILFVSVNLPVLDSVSASPRLLIHIPIVPNLIADNNMKMVVFFCALCSVEPFSCLHNALVCSVLCHLWKHGKCEETGVLMGAAAVCSWCQIPPFALAVISTLNVENGQKTPNAIFKIMFH